MCPLAVRSVTCVHIVPCLSTVLFKLRPFLSLLLNCRALRQAPRLDEHLFLLLDDRVLVILERFHDKFRAERKRFLSCDSGNSTGTLSSIAQNALTSNVWYSTERRAVPDIIHVEPTSQGIFTSSKTAVIQDGDDLYSYGALSECDLPLAIELMLPHWAFSGRHVGQTWNVLR